MNKSGFILWLLVCGILVLDIGQACVRAQDGSSKQMKTQEVDIVDSSGATLAALDTDKNGLPEILLYDPKGNYRMQVTAANDGGSLYQYDATGNQVTSFTTSDPMTLAFYHQKKLSSMLASGNDGSCGLTFMDKNEQSRVQVVYLPAKDLVVVGTGNQKVKTCNAGLSVTPGEADLTVLDSNAKVRSLMGSDAQGVGVGIDTDKGKSIWNETDQSGIADTSATGNSGTSSGSDSNAPKGNHEVEHHAR